MHWILKHQWISFRRSPAFEKDLGVKIFLSILGLFVLLNIIVASFSLEGIIEQFRNDMSPISFINQFLLYYFVIELVIRYFLQTVPVLDIEPYLHLPISKKLISNFLLIKSLFSPYNLLAPAIFIPIYYKIGIPHLGQEEAIIWLIFNLSISLSLHFFNILFKKKWDNSLLAWGVIVIIFTLHYIGQNYLDKNIIPFGYWADMVVNSPIFLSVPLLLLIGLIFICYHFFSSHLYTEDLTDAKMLSGETLTSKLGNWENKGLLNTLVVQELKLILRHKRSRSSLLMAGLFLLYPLFIFSMGEETQSNVMVIFMSIFFTGIFIMQYGQFLWSWNTNQMDFFLTKINPYTLWVESRYRLLLYSALITSVLSIPYIYFGYEIMFAMAMAALYNIGINSMLIIRIGLWSPKPIELDKSSMMNYQGVGAAQFLIGLPVILGPSFIYILFSYLGNNTIGILVVGITGLIGIFLRKKFFNAISKKLKKDKYKLIHDLTI
ncbi:DUF5687 family protein [Marivirga sp.]|uniref:DUF5687 family protein n=1 Tax=Marivirga sp. TaxID=2018662 RepID=UPI0025E699E2|nr:DUF5687 family protein [Marivirga sp.]